MSKRRFGETQEEYEKRLEKEEIEAKTGIKQGQNYKEVGDLLMNESSCDV